MADERVQKEIDAIRADVARLGENVAELTRVLREVGVEKVDGAREKVKEGLGTASEEVRRRVDAARAQGQKVSEDFEDTVRKNPVGSVLGAFGVGVIIAALLGLGGRR